MMFRARIEVNKNMESACLSKVFKTLFSHDVCSRIGSRSIHSLSAQRRQRQHLRGISSQQRNNNTIRDSNWQQRSEYFPPNKLQEFEKYPWVTSNDLRERKQRPKRVRMLTREFIEGMQAGMSVSSC